VRRSRLFLQPKRTEPVLLELETRLLLPTRPAFIVTWLYPFHLRSWYLFSACSGFLWYFTSSIVHLLPSDEIAPGLPYVSSISPSLSVFRSNPGRRGFSLGFESQLFKPKRAHHHLIVEISRFHFPPFKLDLKFSPRSTNLHSYRYPSNPTRWHSANISSVQHTSEP